MVKKKGPAIIFIIFLLIGVIHGLISASLSIFLTWLLIGLWLIISYKVIQNMKKHREFNSPHNTAFFVIIPLFMGIFYSIWGHFTGILGENLIGGSNLYFSGWSLIFGFPYVIFGSYSLYRCFKKYSVIYFGTKSIKARLVGFILVIIISLFIMIYWIIFYSSLEYFDTILIPLHFSFNLNLLLLFVNSIIILIVFGLIKSQRSIPALTNEYIEQRTRRINSLANSNPVTVPRTQRQRITNRNTNQAPLNRTETYNSRTKSYSSRTTPTSYRKIKRTEITHKAKKTSKAPEISHSRRRKIQNLDLYKPIATLLSQEDFKCIFCFKLPKIPEDKGRGIVLCPNCKYPAHADEFRDWVRTSNLCSRCSSPISASYRNNPKVISVKNYTLIYKHFLNKKNNKQNSI
ncbi:MAG: hypothetical protein ACFFKA_12790 [Candidatus Thorarchaeota archaeon]